MRLVTGIVVIGAGQAGLSSAYHLKRLGLEPVKGFLVLDDQESPGGAWLHRWPSLTLSTVNRVHDLPGMALSDTVGTDSQEVQARIAVPRYFSEYEERFGLNVWRPVRVQSVQRTDSGFLVYTDRGQVRTRGLINASGTWQTPHLPEYPGSDRFRGRQLHTAEYRTAAEFAGQHVVLVGGGISAVQLLDEVSRVATTTWVTRREPDFRTGPFDENAGRRATRVAGEPRVHLVGYGPSASTIGANRAGAAAARELTSQLGF